MESKTESRLGEGNASGSRGKTEPHWGPKHANVELAERPGAMTDLV